MKIKRTERHVCDFCGSNNIKLNRAKTKFCLDCKHSISRKGNCDRSPGHFMYEERGYKIRDGDPDWVPVDKGDLAVTMWNRIVEARAAKEPS